MGALLAIGTFALFILIDFLLTRRQAAREGAAGHVPAPAAVESKPRLKAEPRLEPVWVAGYDMPEQLHYHRGHVWARVVAPDTAAVGIDDFGRRLLGKAEGVELPRIGSYIRQGGKGAHIDVEGRGADLVSPVDGEVVAVNTDLDQEPELVSDDPYGRGWLYKIRSTNLAANLRNLLSGSLARKWMEDSREQLEHRLMALSGSVLQDGGEPAPDFAEHVALEEWMEMVEAFLLTQGYERQA